MGKKEKAASFIAILLAIFENMAHDFGWPSIVRIVTGVCGLIALAFAVMFHFYDRNKAKQKDDDNEKEE